MKFVLTFLLIFFYSLSGQAQRSLSELLNLYNTHSVPYISVEELKMLQVNSKVLVLDARERKEFDVSMIPGAMYIGYTEFSSEEISAKINDKDTSIVVYCSLGVRSEEIGEKLKKAGYENVKNLYGGIFEWKNKGYPVLDSTGKETEKVHACSKLWSKWLTKGEKVYE